MTAERLLVTDADNTLWDTDAVYARAQLDLLMRVEESCKFTLHSTDRLSFVRMLDQKLACQHPLGLRYPPQLLVEAIATSGAGKHAESTHSIAADSEAYHASVNKIAADFLARVSTEIPSLRPGVSKTLPLLTASGVKIVVFTEGDPNRCERLLTEHNLRSHISSITAVKKTVEAYEAILRANSKRNDPIMVGDQLDRDIAIAQGAGFKTVYFPGTFEPEWVRTVEVRPDYVISSFDEILDIVHLRRSCGPTN